MKHKLESKLPGEISITSDMQITVKDFIFLGFKITVDSDCSHEIRRCLLLERKAMYDKQCTKKQRHYSADKSPSSQIHGSSQ